MLALVKTFEQVNRRLEEKQFVEMDTLVQCQTQAIDLGNYIEAVYPDEGTSGMIHTLEEYCECLYQLSQQGDISDNRKIVKRVRKLLIDLQNDLHYKLPADKKVIVFLPYKASMWDSLESIYLSAKEDENTETYVVPIPYFDKNRDGSFGQMHYEADQYPDYVEVSSYQQYNLAEEMPDVIYIHNPYDNWNFVTSIHPDFYAKKLRNYTKKLIYVPYFILEEIEPDDIPAIERMKHFCFAPGIIYSDKVIVQSENIRQIYINEFLKAAKESGLQGKYIDRKSLEKKFLGLGSPKIDKVLRTKKENLEIPKDWLKIIEKPDGSWKKIIFYNTGIAALLKYSKKWVDKIEVSLRVFEENKDEIALLWRPHPLVENTMKSMRPEVLKKYLNLKQQYLEEGWGIYDDTADLDRAIMLSSAYYGDFSSVVQIYEKIGKPIMIQNIEVVNMRLC